MLDLGHHIPRKGNRFTAALGRFIFKLFGWKFAGKLPNEPKMVLAVAPHTSNFDFIIKTVLFMLSSSPA